MKGMARDGKLIEGTQKLREDIISLLTTPLGSCVTNRGYGSRLYELIDSVTTDEMDFFQAISEPIKTWISEIDLKRVKVRRIEQGKIGINLFVERSGNQEIIEVVI